MTSDKLQVTSKNNKKNLLIVSRCPSLVTYFGFTLLELIVVIFIVSLVLATSLPSFTRIGESRIKSDAKKLASIIRYLNDTAVSTKNNVYLKIDFKGRVVSYETPEEKRTEKFESISGVELQSRGMVSDGEVVILFGSSGAKESFKVYLSDGKGTKTIILNSLSGRVSITG